ncbi:MAG: universal stress protein [Mycobacteriales bacterium]
MSDANSDMTVVGVDDSAGSQAALRWALRHAHRRDGAVTAVHAWLPTPAFARADLPMFLDLDVLARAGQALLEEQVAEARKTTGLDHVPVHLVCEHGAAGAVLEVAAEGAHALAVGRAQHAAPVRALLGSTAADCLRRSPCPVVVVPPLDEKDTVLPMHTASVYVGVDHQAPSRAALRWAVEVAVQEGKPLVPVHVQSPLHDQDERDLTVLEASDREQERIRDEVAREARDTVLDAVLDVRPLVVLGAPGPALESLVGPEDLVVVGARGRGAVSSALLGSTSHYLVHHCRAPVAVIRTREHKPLD